MAAHRFPKVENVKRPLKKGERFSVPCIVRSDANLMEVSVIKGEPILGPTIFVTPVFNHPHSDKENGQPETHYHVDYRFLKHRNDGHYPTVQNAHSKYFFCEKIRPEDKIDGTIEYFVMPVINETFEGITPVASISNSKLKHNCIHKGKCPHRGYDLSQVSAIDGKITCPLHGLVFDEKTKQIIK